MISHFEDRELEDFTHHCIQLGLVGLIEMSVNWSISKRKMIINLKIKKKDYFKQMFCSFIQLKLKFNCL